MLSLYVHIPFCIHKCSYCDFYSIGVGQRAIPDALYMQRVGEELRAQVSARKLSGQPLRSIFFGGGTPSMVRPELLQQLLNEVRAQFTVSEDIEITCESNPETLTLERLAGLRAAGVNRLSIGVQSFHARHLQFMERVHSAERAEAAVHDAQAAGFHNINIDIIFGLPTQTEAELHEDLQRATALPVQHIAAYQLTVEPQTPLAQQVKHGQVQEIDDEQSLTAWLTVRDHLTNAGYESYEVSNYSHPGFTCLHNQHYWQGGDYLGIGTGAVSRIGQQRWRRARHLKRYLAGELTVDEEESLSAEQLRFERIMLGLRTQRGVPAHLLDTAAPGLAARWQGEGWAQVDQSVILSQSGLAQLDRLLLDIA